MDLVIGKTGVQPKMDQLVVSKTGVGLFIDQGLQLALPTWQAPKFTLPDLPTFNFNPVNLGAGAAGSFVGGAAISLVGPALLLAGGYLIAKKQKWL